MPQKKNRRSATPSMMAAPLGASAAAAATQGDIDLVLGVPTAYLEPHLNAHFTRQQLNILQQTYDDIPKPLTVEGFEEAINKLGGGDYNDVVIALPSLNFQQLF